MSGGIDGIQAAQDAGELPADIQVIGDDQGTGNAGVTTLEIVHGVAPDAKLAFCRVSDEAQLLQCVKQLKQAGAVVVVNDLTAIDNSFAPRYLSQFEALANQKALLWIDAGGDAGENTVNAPFTPVNFAFGANKSVSAMDFGKATGQDSTPYDTITIAAGDKLQFTIWWDDDPGAKHPSNIYIIYLLDRNNNVLAHPPSSAINLSKPHFAGSWTNKTGQAQSVRIVVAHTQGSGDNRIGLWAAETSNGLIESPLTISTTMDLHAQNEAESVLSVGAVDAATPDTIEPYSSAGPTYIEWLYDASTGQYRKAQPPIQRVKPDLVAPDAVSVPTADKHLMNFAGTSAAAPYVAGAAALLESYGLSKAQVVMALEKSAIDLGKSGKDNVYGYGRIDVYKALETVDIPPEVSIMAPSKNIAIDVGTSVTFKGECASNKHTISAYAWDFANGQTSSKKAPGAITFQKAGNYTVELTCTDSTGIKNPEPATRVVTVQAKNNQPSPPPDPNPDHSGGGGAAGPLALLGLLLLGVPMLIWRRVWLEM
jgi:plastocyanin